MKKDANRPWLKRTSILTALIVIAATARCADVPPGFTGAVLTGRDLFRLGGGRPPKTRGNGWRFPARGP